MSNYKVSLKGGWRSDTFVVNVNDPHTNTVMVEVHIPTETFVGMLRNYAPYRPPLGEMQVWAAAIEHYGWEIQRGQVLVPDMPRNADEFHAMLQLVVPEGWDHGERSYNMQRRADDGRYQVGISRKVPHGTKREAQVPLLAPEGTTVELLPWFDVYYDLEEWEQ